MKKIMVVTGTRAEYGLLYWTMKEIQKDDDLKLQLVVTGSHLVLEYGLTVEQIKKDGFKVDEEIDMIINSNNKTAVVKSMGLELIEMASAFGRLKPDLLLILGDRYEIFIAATCAMMMNIPIAHMNGGESTEGAIDEQIRHAITKMAHLHFPGAEYYKERIIKMGEEDWRVHNVGQSGIENVKRLKLLPKEELENQLKMKFTKKLFLITYHPITLEANNTGLQIDNLLNAISKFDAQCIFTYPNADFGSRIIIDKINNFVTNNDNAYVFHSLGQVRYLSLMSYANLMIGNSSSGIIEAPIFKLPVINIGDRQKGRIRSANIVDTGYIMNDIIAAIKKVLYNNTFKKTLLDIENPFGNGTTSKQIVKIIKDIDINSKLLNKKLSY